MKAVWVETKHVCRYPAILELRFSWRDRDFGIVFYDWGYRLMLGKWHRVYHKQGEEKS